MTKKRAKKRAKKKTPAKMGQPTIWTPEKETAFMVALSETCNVTRACKAVGIARQTAYDRYEADAEFKKRWDKAKALGVEAVEDECHRRAYEGLDKPVFYQGEVCGTIREYSDTLAIFLLKAHKPEKYRERYEHSGSGGAPLFPDPDNVPLLEVARRLAFILDNADRKKKGLPYDTTLDKG
jgi:hypothetical protein